MWIIGSELLINRYQERDDRLYDSIFHILKQKASCIALSSFVVWCFCSLQKEIIQLNGW